MINIFFILRAVAVASDPRSEDFLKAGSDRSTAKASVTELGPQRCQMIINGCLVHRVTCSRCRHECIVNVKICAIGRPSPSPVMLSLQMSDKFHRCSPCNSKNIYRVYPYRRGSRTFFQGEGGPTLSKKNPITQTWILVFWLLFCGLILFDV